MITSEAGMVAAFFNSMYNEGGSVGVQGATRLKPCNFGHLPRYLRSVYVQYTSFRFLENAEIKPAGGRRVRQRPFPCPARRLNDVYWTYTERKATQQDTETALS